MFKSIKTLENAFIYAMVTSTAAQQMSPLAIIFSDWKSAPKLF